MTATVARLILAPVVMMATASVYFPVFFVIERFVGGDAKSMLLSDIVCAGFLVIAWLLVWRGEVRWTRTRIVLTAVSVIAAVIPAAFVYGVIVSMEKRADEVAIIVSGMVWALTWLALTALIWRETASERRERLARLGVDAIACPTCGYNLTGLREARCPECGSQFTLDQLYAAATDEKADLDSR